MSDTPSRGPADAARRPQLHRPGSPDPSGAAGTAPGAGAPHPQRSTSAADAPHDTARTPRGGARQSVPVAAGLDVAAVLLFVLVGRRSHAEGTTLTGVLDTAWPFLVALALGWAVTRAWTHPASLRRGAAVAVVVVAGGLLLRVASGEGAPLSFAVVTAVVLGALLVGWRAVAVALRRRAASRR